jgi:MarR family transcriptional regulator, organic hydroperoxide resistance regulator
MKTVTERAAAAEAWDLMVQLTMSTNKPRMAALAHEFELSPMQIHALQVLEPGQHLPMSALAGSLFCDASNVTGIVDRLEARGLIERRGAPHDRRVKMLAVTPEGAKVRERLWRRIAEPPPAMAALPEEDQRTLLDVLRRVVAA